MDGLSGRRVLITRPPAEAAGLAELLVARGAEPVLYPVIDVAAVEGPEAEAVEAAVARLRGGAYDALIFTSANAVELLAQKLQGLELRALVPWVFAVGEKTGAAVRALGGEPILPERSVAEAVVEAVRARLPDLQRRRVLFPRARDGRVVIPDALRAAGAEVDAVTVYTTVPLRGRGPLPSDLAWVTFTSPSAVRAFAAEMTLPAGAKVACIGPTTARAAEDAGYDVAAVPARQSIEALVDAMAAV